MFNDGGINVHDEAGSIWIASFHPPYFSDVASSNFHFHPPERVACGKCFRSDDAVRGDYVENLLQPKNLTF